MNPKAKCLQAEFFPPAPLQAIRVPFCGFQSQAAIRKAHLFNQFPGGGTVGRSVDRSMLPLLFSPPLAHPLYGRALRFGEASLTGGQVVVQEDKQE